MKSSFPKVLEKSLNLFPVVGVGASAGGLEAFKKLLQAIPVDSGMAFVLVQHLDPKHESMLPEILQKFTRIPVLEITDDIKVEPNHIYVIPSNKMLISTNGVLLLAPRKIKSGLRNMPIDLFFASLAEVHQAHAIGVILSGSADDGTLGLKAIKEHGGITFAQDNASAASKGMPSSAIDAGVVDFILPPEEIPAKLSEVTKIIHAPVANEEKLHLEDAEVFKQINAVLYAHKGTDFSYYKQTTIRRRIFRRMAINKIENTATYLQFLQENKPEQDILYQDILIPVTAFFRDATIFEHLCEKTFPLLLKDKLPGENIRIWVAGCSTGEEAYSIAICFKELLGNHSLKESGEKVQIFATDLSEPAIAKARIGTYSKIEVAGLSSQRLHDFFTKTGNTYRVNKSVRDLCVFANHNFLKDPPFGKMDFISCRNVLIYMESYLQKKALAMFHYALNPKKFLLLGKSETTSHVPDLFAPAEKNDKLYTRKDVPSKFVQVASARTESNISHISDKQKTENMRSDFQKIADEIILNKYMPAGVIVNEAMDIIQFRGSTSNYLEQLSGKPSHNLLILAKHGLSFELRNILHKAKKEKTTVLKENIPIQVNDYLMNVSIEAIPLPNTIEPHYLILFHDSHSNFHHVSTISNKKTTKSKADDKDLRLKQLEEELAQTREDMRSITEDQEAANEELQSANEELLSGSEELQSLNEELETSKEELQSTNEELTVVNQETIGLNEQLEAAKNYSQAIVENIREPLLVLDKNLRVKTANKSFYKTFRVNEEETLGMLVYELGKKQWDIPALRLLLEKMLPEKSIFNDFEVTHAFPNIGVLTMLLNAREVIDKSSSEKSILLSIEDITDRKELHDVLEKAVEDRTNELKQSNEELIRTNKELYAFTYISSHDLQEPLRKIQIFASRILDKESQNLSDSGKNYFRLMEDAANRMQTLIEDLLTFSRLTTAERVFAKTDLNTIIENVQADFKDTIEEKQAIITVGKLCSANIIAFQFHQLMQNLIGNALKFSKADCPPHIKVECDIVPGKQLNNSKVSPQKNYCHISISDNGIGFEKEFNEKIFEVFQKLHGKEVYGGTGIGLAIVKKIVDNHNGFITAQGKLGEGATFDIYIPN